MHRVWQGKDIRLCTKSYSSQEVEAMQLDTKLAEVTNAQKKQRVEDQSDPPFDPGICTGCTCLPPTVWHFTTATHPCLRTCTHAHLSACAKAAHPFWLSASAKAAHPS